MGARYSIVRFFQREGVRAQVVREGLSLEQAQEHCNNPETKSATCKSAAGKRRTATKGDWFDGYRREE